jgi:tetratricopeptide (TPR) repeat protein
VGADRVVDLRVEDHPNPLAELRRLVQVHRAYVHMNRGDDCAEKRDWAGAVREYGAAEKILPDSAEVVFWHAVTLVTAGKPAAAMPLFKRVFAKEPKWAELLERLPAAGLFPKDTALIKRIQALRPAQ